ncbi:protein draper-like isoform X2 [Mizuhopecten yessoensis]|uniref:protein draper-like isoform X2 n=1 Tax=Mizuhopecten yessoensis TaxID=6573 RepID=UPI000B45BDEF|nr:protein draper-like isoform X2 [Mizuhopecten yessoensis]
MFGYKLIVSDTEDRRRWNSNHQIEGHICRDETRRNPPLQQSVPCLARGRFITYADNVDNGDYNPYVELCELEAYGCPTGWFGQDNCLEKCPDGCRDTVCNPDNGTCFAGCESGLQGDICDTTCNHGSFGLWCQQFCFCDVDTCDPQNGTCPSDRCQRGWNGTACNQRCGDQTFGQNCEETCHCLQGSCDAANGTCIYEGCEPGWQTESCSIECDKGRFGHDCNLTCGACRHNAPCDHVTGKCPNGCSDGWTTSFCDESCPIGTFGINCTGECFCKNGTCDPTNGVCPGNACDRGWNGPSCSSQCDPGSYGYNCKQSCNCQTESCNRTTGQCPPGGSKDGWRTDNCSQKHQYEVNGSQDSLANTKCIIGYAILGTVLAISVFYNIGLTVFCLRQSRRIKTPPKSATAHEMQPISVSQDNSNYDGLDTTKVDNVKNIYETIGK